MLFGWKTESMAKQFNNYKKLWYRAKSLWTNPNTIRTWVDSEFYQYQVGQLPEGLSAESHYLRYGWLENHQPHPLFDADFYQQTCIRKGLETPSNPALLHFCRHHARTKTFQDVPPAAFDSRKSRTWPGTETARRPTPSRPWHCNLRIFFPKLSTTAAAPQRGWRRARRPRLLFSFN